jgi:hypothetical protein
MGFEQRVVHEKYCGGRMTTYVHNLIIYIHNHKPYPIIFINYVKLYNFGHGYHFNTKDISVFFY